MARAASSPKKEISMEEALWKSADKLRGSVEPAEYKHVTNALKTAPDAFFFIVAITYRVKENTNKAGKSFFPFKA